MGRDDDLADAPRRVPLSSSGNGSARSKRTPQPSNIANTYDPAIPQVHHTSMYVSPNDAAHYTSGAYATEYAPRSVPTYSAESVLVPPTSATNKRKRVKKERDDEWAPAPPPPPPSMVYATNANDMAMHMTMPTILHRASSGTAAVSAPPPSYEPPYAAQSSTIFSEAPVVIESFAETERRRANAAAASASASTSSTANLSQLIHADQTASATSTPKINSNGVAAWNNRTVSSGTMSVYDLFFPTSSRTKEGSTSRNGTREPKRRRRNNGDATDRTTRASRRAGATSDDSLEVDMLQFTVDSFKLIPQGLVDCIDARLRPAVIASLVTSHVENWIKRAGADDQNFLQEISTMLNMWYPCTHAMILDEILVAFVFKRPELMERMMKSIIERLQKTGESITASKYPVVEAFARRCGMTAGGGILKRDKARHELACLTVLRLLLERNTEKFMLSPWIASCASLCSDEALDAMWEALLRPLVSSVKASADSWSVRDPLDQVFELLREDKKLSRNVDDGLCKLSITLIKKIVQDEAYTDLRSAPVTCEAFEVFFGHCSSSARLIEPWVASERRENVSHDEALFKVVRMTVENCSRLSVKKTNWFIKHMLGQISSLSTTRIFDELIVQHADLFLGGVSKSEMEEIQVFAPSEASQSTAENGGVDEKIIVGRISSNEKNATAGVVTQVGLFLDALRARPESAGSSVVRAWSEKWCTQDVLVPWSYVWGVVTSSMTSEESDNTPPSQVDASFNELACQLLKHYVAGLLRRASTTRALTRVVRIVKATIQNLPSTHATALLESVLEGVAQLPKTSPLAEKTHSIIAVTLGEQIASSGEVEKRQQVDTPISKPGERTALLLFVDALASRQDAMGQLVRDQLIRRSRMGKIILEVLQDGDDVQAGAAIKIMTNIVRGSPLDDLWTTSAIETVITMGYRVRLPSTRHSAITLLHAIAHSDGVSHKLLLWSVLRLCTTYCCGCYAQSRPDKFDQTQPEAVSEFADLTKFMLKRASRDVLVDVGNFIQQQIRSCGPNKEQWNLFLVLVLDRVVQLGWSLLAAAPKLAHLVLTPFETVGLSPHREDRIMQLRALKSLCVALLAESLSQSHHSKRTSWVPIARALVSDQLAAKLKVLGSSTVCATSVALTQSIVALCEEIKESMDAKGLTQNTN